MRGFLQSTFIALILFGCRAPEVENSCEGLSDCLVGKSGYVIGNSAEDRRNALVDIENAAAVFKTWGVGAPPLGVVVLDAQSRFQAEVLNGIAWVLVWDPSEAGSLRAGLEGSPGATSPASRVTLDDSPIAFDMQSYSAAPPEDGATLEHEICHRYAAAVYRSKQDNRAYPSEVVDEMSALSCEPPEILARRRAEFFKLLDNGSEIKSLPQFFADGHPLKRSPSLQAALADLERAGQSTIRFRLDPSSVEAEATAVFYGQAATLLEFLVSTSCQRTGIIGSLLSGWSDSDTLSSWLMRNSNAACLPATAEGLSAAFVEYVNAARRS